ncbi:MAG TPA: cereblon family protein [Polyangia bacterium]
MRHAFKPDGSERARALDEKRAGSGGGGARAYWCAACDTRVADDDAAIEVAGAHRHSFVNPAGVTFEIGCFAEARCRVEGAPTLAATWFAGFAWSFALCANCGAHLGWAYDGEGARFFGLVLARLVGPI